MFKNSYVIWLLFMVILSSVWFWFFSIIWLLYNSQICCLKLKRGSNTSAIRTFNSTQTPLLALCHMWHCAWPQLLPHTPWPKGLSQAGCLKPQSNIPAMTTTWIHPKKNTRTRWNGPWLREGPSSPPCSNRRPALMHPRVASSPLFGNSSQWVVSLWEMWRKMSCNVNH